MSAAVFVVQMLNLVKNDLGLILHNAELADPVVGVDLRIAHSIHRHEPLIIVAAVRTVYHAVMIGLDDAEILKRGTSRNHMGLIAFRQFHGDSQRDQLKFPCFKDNVLRGPQVDPIGFPVYVSQLIDFIRKILDLDRFQSCTSFRGPRACRTALCS